MTWLSLHWAEVVSFFVSASSVIAAVWTFTKGLTEDKKSGLRPLTYHMSRAIGAGSVPVGIILLVGAIWPPLLAMIPGLNLQLAIGGLAILYGSFDVLWERALVKTSLVPMPMAKAPSLTGSTDESGSVPILPGPSLVAQAAVARTVADQSTIRASS